MKAGYQILSRWNLLLQLASVTIGCAGISVTVFECQSEGDNCNFIDHQIPDVTLILNFFL
jgi:hypothetical protein